MLHRLAEPQVGTERQGGNQMREADLRTRGDHGVIVERRGRRSQWARAREGSLGGSHALLERRLSRSSNRNTVVGRAERVPSRDHVQELKFLRRSVPSLSTDVSLTVMLIRPINVLPSRAIRSVEVVAPDLDVTEVSEMVIAVDRDAIADRLEQDGV